MEKKGLSPPEGDGVVGMVFVTLVLLVAAGFIFWFAFDAAKRLLEGK